MRGGALPHKNNLIGTVDCGWTLIGPFKMHTKALFIKLACSKTMVLIVQILFVLSLPTKQENEIVKEILMVMVAGQVINEV